MPPGWPKRRTYKAGGSPRPGTCSHFRKTANLKKLLVIIVSLPILIALGWLYFHERTLTDLSPAYREYAYVTNSKSNSVAVIDLTPNPIPSFRVIKTIQVGSEPAGVAANPRKNEVYVVSTQSNN